MTARFIPATSLEGGTPIGSSYLRAYHECPYKFFNQYIRPVGELEDHLLMIGIKARWQAPPLSAGSMFHSFMEELYHSRCKDGEDTGEWDIDRAMAVLRVVQLELKDGYQKEAEYNKDCIKIDTACREYVDYYGPTVSSRNPEWPRYQVVFDGEGEPIIERQFKIDLGYNDYYITIQPDLIMTRDGYLITRDHKTAAKGWGPGRAANIDTDAQFTMEYMVLSELFPEEAITGAEVNVIQTGYVPGNKVKDFERFIRNTTTRSLADIASFKADTIDLLEKIDTAVANFEDLWETTGDLELAAGLAFPRHGMRIDACHTFRRPCDFIDLCVHKGNIGNNLGSFRPRRVEKVEEVTGD